MLQDIQDADRRPAGTERSGCRGGRAAPSAGRRAGRRTDRRARRRRLRALGDCTIFLGSVLVAIGLPGWVEYIL